MQKIVNTWLHSSLRQYFNSTGTNWWEPATAFDHVPVYSLQASTSIWQCPNYENGDTDDKRNCRQRP